MKQYLFNPFLRIAGSKALLIGLATMLLTSFIAMNAACHFDGAIDVHLGAPTANWFYFAETLIDWACISLCFYFSALIVSKSKTRIIDIFGTVALARMPMLLVALTAFICPQTIMGIKDINSSVILFLVITLLATIWMIALLYNAYTISANTKGNKAIISFIISLLLAEIISKLIIIKLYPQVLSLSHL